MRSRSPSIIPNGQTVHLVLCDFGRQGLAYVETEPVITERDVVDNLLEEQYERPVEIIAFNVGEGWARDVSEDIAAAAAERARSLNLKVGAGTKAFLEEQLGEELEPELCL
jgi:hypothetical protein